MIESWVWAVMGLGAGLVLIGGLMIRRSGSEAAAGDAGKPDGLDGPLDEQGWIGVVVQLALRVSRSDGVLDASEITTIEEALTGGEGGLDRSEAERLVGLGLRSTIQPTGLDLMIERLGAFASPQQRDWVLAVLIRVAEADGSLTSSEHALIDQVRERFGRV